jgi:hypothetical protein
MRAGGSARARAFRYNPCSAEPRTGPRPHSPHPPVTASIVFRKIDDWLLRRRLVDEARAELANLGERRTRALEQARLLAEVEGRVENPVETLPPGSAPAVALDLYREAVYWALVAMRPADGEPPSDLRALWDESAAGAFLRLSADGVDVDVGAARSVLVDRTGDRALDPKEETVARARQCADALVAHLLAPRRRLGRLLAQRWVRVGLASLAIVLAAVGARRMVVGPNLVAGKTFRASSSWSGCKGDARCDVLLFHTDVETNPWATVDLGAPTTVRTIEITNREDCCAERAVPLVVEMSDDDNNWTEIARRDEEFKTWKAKLPPKTARYLRFKIPKPGAVLHLRDIVVRP